MAFIQINTPSLRIRAGSRALLRLRERGLRAEDVAIIPGAAGGPKGLGIQGLDIALFGDWLAKAPRPRTLVGASIGSWRFASACLPDPVAGIKRLGELYTSLRYAKNVTMQEISQSCVTLLDALLQGQDQQLLNHPYHHLNIMVVKSLGRLEQDTKGALTLGLASVIADNFFARKRLGRHFERVLLHDPRQAPPFAALTDFKSQQHDLNTQNLRQALLASGSIPMVMQAIKEIPGLAPASYRDGGLLDYHLDLPYQSDGLVLYPHFTDRVIPGWFDKSLKWRKACAENMQDVVLLAPSPEYLARLPHQKLPDRTDFKRYLGDDDGRERYWRLAMQESTRLGDEFLALSQSASFADRVLPL